jgi:hemerythrin-like metal-binding protein/PAS domain S-box-containing protein
VFELLTPISYWILSVLWLTILGLYLAKLRHSKLIGGTVAALLTILAIDAFRTAFESVYFGLYFNSFYGWLPISVHEVLSQPSLLIIPKMINIVAGIAVLILLVRRWVPRELREREELIDNLRQSNLDLEQETKNRHTLFETSTAGLALTRLDGTLVDLNSACASMMGRTVDEAIGKQNRDLFCRKYADLDQIQFDELKETGKYGPYETELSHIDGHTVPVLLTGRLIDLNGESFIWSSIQDLTALKHLQEQLQHSQRMEAVGQLSGGIAHDFNNVLGIIQGNLELLQELMPDDEKLSLRVEKALAGAARGANITRKLLSFSRRETHSTELVSVNDLVVKSSELVGKSLTAIISIEHFLADDIWPVVINPGDLEDAILNLSLNARDAMPQGGTLTIETSNQVLDQTFVDQHQGARSGEFVKISIKDTGSGMSAAVLDKAMEPFFSTKDKSKGTGLGLSLVYGFVKRSKGYLSLSSTVGLGTSIDIFLPRASSANDQPEEADLSKHSGDPGTESILVVDDEPDLADIARGYLEGAGYKVQVAHSGEVALDILARDSTIDMLFSDVIMPGPLNGYELALNSTRLRPELRVGVTSGFDAASSTELVRDNIYVKHYADALLHKPYDRNRLLQFVREILDEEYLLPWSNDFVTGITELDNDHKMLVSLLNRLYVAAFGEISEPEIVDIFGRLLEYTAHHFQREEAIMAACQFPDRERHCDLHKTLIAAAVSHYEIIKNSFSKADLDAGLNFLKDWLLEHIIGEDMQIAKCARAKEAEVEEALNQP